MMMTLPRSLAGAAVLLLATNLHASDTAVSADTHKADYSYVQGYIIGQRINRTGIDFDTEAFAEAVGDAMSGKKMKFTQAQVQQITDREEQNQKDKLAATVKAATDKGNAYMAENKTKPGVKTLPSGVQYKALKTGSGPSPKPTQLVKVHYEGKTLDGEVFDSSLQRGEPATFGVTQVIPGFSQALQAMKIGDHWEVTIPGHLAYGEQGAAGGKIGPGDTLIFDLQLLEISDPVVPKAPAMPK